MHPPSHIVCYVRGAHRLQGAPLAAHPQPGDHAHGDAQRRRPPPAEHERLLPPHPAPAGPSSQAAHPQCAPGCMAHTHTVAHFSWRRAAPGGPQHGRTAHARRAPPQRRHGASPRDPHAQPNYMAHPAPHTSTGEAVCGPVALPFPRDRNVDVCAARSKRANRPCLTSPSCAASCAPHAPHPHRRGSASWLLHRAAR